MLNEVTGNGPDTPPVTQGLLIPEPASPVAGMVQQTPTGGDADQGVAPALPVPMAAVVTAPEVKVPPVGVVAAKARQKVRGVLTRDSWLGSVGEVVLLDAAVADAAEAMGAIDPHPAAIKDAHKTRTRR